ncbi:hypothetical protein E9549_07835 [Blastococcus sp. MG754426]|uniref:hypothetical protein n=1 Tax=unclassified Blastococcus TaxID=2619396 RepID=UPI001EEFC1C5|nr:MULTISPECIES: hypothetical protein [unclassified Blastococcus]MCF6507318.1 hypothetical protein [Blastococcus sp. MG754426]MCF6510804.1 hypothetical protein [Blastococcus sp. MG754427]
MSTATRLDGPAEATDGAPRPHPNVSGDLPTLFRAAPMFRRALAGYDRFQVDTYVQWAEDELATAEREREHLLDRCLQTRTALDEAHRLLDHSAGGGELLRLSGRIGSMLAAAADEAQGMTAEAEQLRAAARAEAEELRARAADELARARAGARETAAAATARAGMLLTVVGRTLDAAEQIRADAVAEAERRGAEAHEVEQRAAERAARFAEEAAAEVARGRLQGHAEVLRVLEAGREQRRRADAEAAAHRERLDREAADRRAALLAEVAALEHRRAELAAEVERAARTVPPRADDPAAGTSGRFRDRVRRLRSPRAGTA